MNPGAVLVITFVLIGTAKNHVLQFSSEQLRDKPKEHQ